MKLAEILTSTMHCSQTLFLSLKPIFR